MISERELQQAQDTGTKLRKALSQVIVGHEPVIDGALITFLCAGNLLLEGVPGLGKTLLVRSLASALDLRFSRIQFTPDLMPADILGTDILTQDDGTRRFSFSPGPIFAHVVLADEINRATPKTQSALLEAMEERTVSVGKQTYTLEEPFIVLATQNPIEMEGTYPLPEAQVDRFLLKILVEPPSIDELVTIAERNTERGGLVLPEPVASGAEILACRRVVSEVPIAGELRQYIARLVLATHPQSPLATPRVKEFVEYGASPRAAIALIRAAKGHAFLAGEPNVRREDIEAVFRSALVHRVILNFRGEAEGVPVTSLLQEIWVHTAVV